MRQLKLAFVTLHGTLSLLHSRGPADGRRQTTLVVEVAAAVLHDVRVRGDVERRHGAAIRRRRPACRRGGGGGQRLRRTQDVLSLAWGMNERTWHHSADWI